MLKIIGSQWGNLLLRIISALALTPFLIGRLGAEGYGIWLFLNAVVGYLTMLQSGLPAASLRHLSEELKGDDYGSFNQVLASSLALFGFISGLVLLAGCGLLALSEYVINLPDRWQSDGRIAFGLATIAIATTLMSNPVMTVMEAHGSYLGRNLIEMTGTVIRTGLTIALVLWLPSLTMVGVAAFCAELGVLIGLVAFVKKSFPAVRLSMRGWDRARVRTLFSFSMVVFMTAMGARFSYKTDALVIGIALPMAAVSVYSVANTLALYLSRLVSGVAEPLMPRATQLRNLGQDDQIQMLFLKWSKVSMSFALMFGLFLLVLGPAFIAWWINPQFGEQASLVLRILVFSFVLMLPASAVGFRFLLGLTRPMNLAMAHLAAGILNLALSILLVGPFGLTGVAVGTAIPNLLLGAVILVLTCREIGIDVSRYLAYVVLKPLLGALPVCGLLIYLERVLPVPSLPGLIVAGMVHVALFTVVWVMFVYRHDQYLDLAKRIHTRVVAFRRR